ncbi:MAG: sigma-70 family RNA polymerase sigma factor [bacterium]
MHSIDLDTRLVLGMAQGDKSALGQLYDRHAPLLLGVALRLLGDRPEAEDLVHDVLIEAWQRADTYDPARASVRSWLLLRLRSRALDRLRSARISRRAGVSDEDLARRPAEVVEDPALTPDRGRLGQQVGQLPDAQHAVVQLIYFEGLSAREAADRLGVPMGTVKSRLAAGIDKLRAALGAPR